MHRFSEHIEDDSRRLLVELWFESGVDDKRRPDIRKISVRKSTTGDGRWVRTITYEDREGLRAISFVTLKAKGWHEDAARTLEADYVSFLLRRGRIEELWRPERNDSGEQA